MTTLQTNFDLRAALETVRDVGAIYIQDAVSPDHVDALRADAARVPFERMPAEEGRARQGGEQFQLTKAAMPRYPAIEQVGKDLARAVHVAGDDIPGCTEWTPNEVYVQRYHAGDLGITPHLDLKRYRYLVAVLTVEGDAKFTICKNRDGDPLATWQTRPAGLVLLRAPGYDLLDDGRPLHSVEGPPESQRISISYRMDTRKN